MTLNEYQKQAMTTCTDSSENFAYMSLNLVGEVGEFMGKVAKAIRKERMDIDTNNLTLYEDTPTVELNDLKCEAGDILWQLSGLCSVMGWSLEDIARLNLYKLASRKERGVIVGNGDNR